MYNFKMSIEGLEIKDGFLAPKGSKRTVPLLLFHRSHRFGDFNHH
jgi:hypothetical protein